MGGTGGCPSQKRHVEGATSSICSLQRRRRIKTLVLSDGVALRGLFLIDKEGVVRHLLINDLPLGRSVEEVLRMIDALTHFEQHGEVCPADW